MTSDLTVRTCRPEPDEWAWAVGGRPAVRRVQPGTVLELHTEDCFGRRVQGVEDLPSQICIGAAPEQRDGGHDRARPRRDAPSAT